MHKETWGFLQQLFLHESTLKKKNKKKNNRTFWNNHVDHLCSSVIPKGIKHWFLLNKSLKLSSSRSHKRKIVLQNFLCIGTIITSFVHQILCCRVINKFDYYILIASEFGQNQWGRAANWLPMMLWSILLRGKNNRGELGELSSSKQILFLTGYNLAASACGHCQ